MPVYSLSHCPTGVLSEYALHDGFASRLPNGLSVFLYHSRDDEVVPFAHLALYSERLAQATIHELMVEGISSTTICPKSPRISKDGKGKTP